MNTTPTPREEHNQIKKRQSEIEKEISKLKREDAELEQKRIALVFNNPDLQLADTHQPIYASSLNKPTPHKKRPNKAMWSQRRLRLLARG